MKTPEQFYNEIMTNDELYERFLASLREGKADEFLRENEVEGTVEEFERFFTNKLADYGELTDEQLEAISGGGLFSYFADKVKEKFPSVYRAIDEVVYRAKKAYRDAVYDATH
ncbi:MAG: hypothetical protein ACI4JZ_10340 [Oscillospiraceae bacterium]